MSWNRLHDSNDAGKKMKQLIKRFLLLRLMGRGNLNVSGFGSSAVLWKRQALSLPLASPPPPPVLVGVSVLKYLVKPDIISTTSSKSDCQQKNRAQSHPPCISQIRLDPFCIRQNDGGFGSKKTTSESHPLKRHIYRHKGVNTSGPHQIWKQNYFVPTGHHEGHTREVENKFTEGWKPN